MGDTGSKIVFQNVSHIPLLFVGDYSGEFVLGMCKSHAKYDVGHVQVTCKI